MKTADATNTGDTGILDYYRMRQRRRKRNAIIAAVTALVIVLGACAGVWWTVGGGSIIAANLTKPAAQPATEEANMSVTAFAYRSAPEFLAMESARDPNGNMNYSPASMWMALSLTAQGAKGGTRSQLDELLGTGSLAETDYRSLMNSINGRYDGSRSQMSAANSLWVDDGITLADGFRSTVSRSFDAEVVSADFGDRNGVAERMGRWVSQHTQGMLKPNVKVSEREIMSVINTVYADGRWQDPFDPEFTTDEPFHGADGESTVRMMHRVFDSMVWAHDTNDTWQRVMIPFDNGGALVVLLPADGHFDEIAGDAERMQWALGTCANEPYGCVTDAAPGWGVSSEPRTVYVSMPVFTIDSMFASDETIATLKSLGVTDAFDDASADFSGMTADESQGIGRLFIGTVVQGTRIEVNEHGARAAAFTKSGTDSAGAPADPVEFTVDRPFLYALTTPDGIPLFIGAVRNL